MDHNNSATLTQPSIVTAGVKPLETKTKRQVLAYAMLKGDDFKYFIRTLDVTLGRSTKNSKVDVDLGSVKCVSRLHAKIIYQREIAKFELFPLGKNGLKINNKSLYFGESHVLENNDKIIVGNMSMLFNLPNWTLPSASYSSLEKLNKGQYQSTNSQKDESHCFYTDVQISDKFIRPMLVKKENPMSLCSSPPQNHQYNIPSRNNGTNAPEFVGEKPRYSYASIIAQILDNVEGKKLTLHEIYTKICNKYPYFKAVQNGWQNSVRHNLSLNPAFIKIPRKFGVSGKGAFWKLDTTMLADIGEGVYRKPRETRNSYNPLNNSFMNKPIRINDEIGHRIDMSISTRASTENSTTEDVKYQTMPSNFNRINENNDQSDKFIDSASLLDSTSVNLKTVFRISQNENQN